MNHPKPVEGDRSVPWEVLGQIAPSALPAPGNDYPGPWSTHDRGNGHVDVTDGLGRVFAHVHCWDDADCKALANAVKQSEDAFEAELTAVTARDELLFRVVRVLHEERMAYQAAQAARERVVARSIAKDKAWGRLARAIAGAEYEAARRALRDLGVDVDALLGEK